MKDSRSPIARRVLGDSRRDSIHYKAYCVTQTVNRQQHQALKITNMADEYQTYKLGNFKLQLGGEIPDAFIAYKTLGDPSLPAIVYPTWYSGCELSA